MATPESNAGSYLNVLQWIHSLRLTCNLGTTYSKQDVESVLFCNWTAAAAQEAYQRFDASGAAMCSQC